MSVTPSQFEMLNRLADVSMLRQRVIANNVANVNTPGYRSQRVDFEDVLTKQLEQGRDSVAPKLDFARINPEMREDTSNIVRVDGNSVNINKEMGRLNKNKILYQTYMNLIKTKVQQMRTAIGGSGA